MDFWGCTCTALTFRVEECGPWNKGHIPDTPDCIQCHLDQQRIGLEDDPRMGTRPTNSPWRVHATQGTVSSGMKLISVAQLPGGINGNYELNLSIPSYRVTGRRFLASIRGWKDGHWERRSILVHFTVRSGQNGLFHQLLDTVRRLHSPPSLVRLPFDGSLGQWEVHDSKTIGIIIIGILSWGCEEASTILLIPCIRHAFVLPEVLVQSLQRTRTHTWKEF